jgi:hypothetical protein
MSLDFVLDHSCHEYLATEQEKVAYFTGTLGLSHDDLPVKRFRSPTAEASTARYFVDKYPIFVPGESTPLVSFCFVDEGVQTGARFESFLKEHNRLFERLDRFELIYVCTPDTPFQACETVFRRSLQFATPQSSVPTGLADVNRLIDHFEDRQMYDVGDLDSFDRARLIRLRGDKQTYSGRRFDELYSRWQTGGRAALERSLSTVLPSPQSIDARFSIYFLRHNYDVFGTVSNLTSH